MYNCKHENSNFVNSIYYLKFQIYMDKKLLRKLNNQNLKINFFRGFIKKFRHYINTVINYYHLLNIKIISNEKQN